MEVSMVSENTNTSNNKSKTSNKGTQGHTTKPIYKKYDRVMEYGRDPDKKLKPSDMAKSAINISGDDYPMIIELVNILDNTSQIHATVDIDQPLFEPAPNIVIFEDYAPFAVHEKKLFFRNKDSVARRVKIFSPDSPFFEVSAPRASNGDHLKQSKIAAGMEVMFIVKFKAQEVRDYSYDLVCSTEREKFLVPIRAIGNRPNVTFPDDLSFGTVPVKSSNTKMMFVQNIGRSTAKFTLKTRDNIFTCPSEEFIMEAGASQMIEVTFTPDAAQHFTRDIEVEFFKGTSCFIKVEGSGKNVDVALSTPSLAVDPCYISLVSQQTLRIINHSNTPISFAWRSFANSLEEDVEKQRLLTEINRMEEIEMANFLESVRRESGWGTDGDFGTDRDDDSVGDEADGTKLGISSAIPLSAKAAEAALIRKYRNLRVALEKDPMSFVDDIFEISPVEGQVWSNSEMEVTVTFRPDTAALFTCLAYLDISGREDRLNLHLNGQGIGPKASLSYDVLDTGDVFINDDQEYNVTMTNKGDIPAKWSFLSSLTKFGSKFKFTPSEGDLVPGESVLITINFTSDILGEFSEHFRFALQGNEDMILFQVKGHVIGPTFHMDCNSIDFGTVSFDYLHTASTRLVNSSKIPMMYIIHIPQDGKFMKQEFDVTPNEGVLVPGEFVDVTVEFIPQQVKVYDYSLAVDVLGVGEMLLSTPILAECIIEPVTIAKRELSFGDCFLRHPYTEDFVLINPSQAVHTKFEFQDQNEASKGLAVYRAEPATGFIEPGGSFAVKMHLVPHKLGQSKVPVALTVAGSLEPPQQASLSFNCVGPRILLDQRELKWGNIECLKDEKRTLLVTNDSLITAEIHFFLKSARSRFELPLREAVLQPNEELVFEIKANVDDTIVHKEELHIMITNSSNMMVPLSAKGIGTTMYCKQDIQVIDFGPQLTDVNFERRITLENKGKRPQQLRWYNDTLKQENLTRLSKVKQLKQAPSTLPKHLAPSEGIFSVHPEEITLRPRTATTFIFRGVYGIPGPISELFILESKVGKDRNMVPIIKTEAKAEIQSPLLECSVRDMSFVYEWELNKNPAVIKKELVLTNRTSVALGCIFKTEVPFNLSAYDHVLEPEETLKMTVEFDPSYRDDKTSCLIEKSLSISYRGHSQKDSIKLMGEIIFPNLKFETNTINFGAILNETEKRVKCKVTNSSKVVCSYNWIFMENEIPNKPPPKGKGHKKHLELGTKAELLTAAVPPNQAFDILPIRSILQPGESEDVEFVLFGHTNSKFNCFAICEVEGGPEYKLNLMGESSTVSYSLDCSYLDFGRIVYTEFEEREITLINKGRVPYNWNTNTDNLSSPGLFAFIPSEGMVEPNDEMKITVKFRPGVPKKFAETVFINVAHFDPAKITLYGEGKFPVATVTLPRYRHKGPLGEKENVKAAWEAFVRTATDNIITPDPTFIAPFSAEEAPPIPSADSAIPVEYEPTPRVELIDEGERKVGGIDGDDMSESKAPKPKQEALDVEMTRMTFSELLENAIDTARKDLAEADATSLSSTESGTLCNQAVVAKCIDVTTLYTATYLCDFGNVLAGTTKKKVFKVVNSSEAGVMSWSFDNVAAGREGFNMDPDAVVKMPEGSSQEFAVKFSTRNQKPGKKKYVLNVCIKGTGTIRIMLMANICIPELELSHTALDFERVYVGCSKKVFFRVHNTTPVKAMWNLKAAQGSRDESRFVFTPSSGSLRSGKKTVISCEFMPVEGRVHNLDAILKVDMNNKPKTITISAESLNTPLKFEPTFLEQGPILPFSFPGDEKIVTVVSNCEVPVELYSLDFDTQYKKEEDMLTTVADLMFDSDGCLRVPVRNAGSDLDDSIQKVYAEATYVPPEPEPVELAEAENGDADGKPQSTEENAELGADYGVEESTKEIIETEKILFPPPPLRSSSCPRDDELHQDIIVVAPPVCGSSSVSASLSKKLVLPSISVDSLITEIAGTDGEFGYRARRATKTLTAEEIANIGEKEEALKNAADASKETATSAYMAANKKAKEVPPEVLETPEVTEYNIFLSQSNVDVDFFVAMISHRLSWDDVGHGVIIDDVVSIHADESIVVQALKQALPKAIVCTLNLEDGEAAFLNRIQGVYESKLAEEKRLGKLLHQARLKLSQRKKGKKKDRKASTGMIETAPPNNPDDIIFSKALPEGDESWVDQVTGCIIELDSQDIRSLDDQQKVEYNNQLLWYQQEQLRITKTVLKSILAIWNPETKDLISSLEPLVDDAEAAVDENGEGEAAVAGTSDSPEKEVSADADPVGRDNTEEAVANEIVEGSEEKVENEKNESSEPEKKIILFSKYINEILPVVKEVFADPPSTEEPMTENEEQAVESAPAAETEATEKGENAEEGTAVTVEEAPKGKEFGIFEIPVGVNDLEDAVNQSVLALIPAAKVPPFDKDAIPATVESQLIRRPYPRIERKAVNNFEILEYIPESVEGEEEGDVTAAPTNEALNGEEAASEMAKRSYRWTIPAFGQIQFKVRFTSKAEGKIDNALMFEVMGSKQEFSLFCSGRCELPRVNGDPRIVFTKRARAITPGAPLPMKRYAIADNCFSFGPILSFKQPDWRITPAEDADDTVLTNNALVATTNCDMFRLTNTGSYSCQVHMGMLTKDENPTFYVDEPSITLEEGETKEVKVWAFPREAEVYKNSLIATVSNNPEPLKFDLICSGVVPTIALRGPWEEAIATQLKEAEAALEEANAQPKPDKKAIEELNNRIETLKAGGDGALPIPFDRMLIGKTDTRSFQVSNSSDLPLIYNIDPEDFSDSANITISPQSGTLNPGQGTTITIAFSSQDPLVLNGKFSLRYSDVEGGIDVAERTFTKQFQLTCEAYKITTVSLTAEGEETGGNEVDYGLLRVGDYAHKTVKMMNKGKYKIAYKIDCKRPATSDLLTLMPSEGEIEPDETVDIEVTFCSKSSKIELKNNKDIRVAISEPATGETVEEFPLYITANAEFAKYRMQPAKGIQFGAVRFDSEPSTKRVELRNEGKYEFTYVVTPISSEVSELDALDQAAFACYAYSLPAATRNVELGEGYVEKAGGGESAAPAKGKPAKGAPSADAKPVEWNPLVKDPDNLHPHPLPDDPLVVGAFTVVQRCGSVAPGETTGFDIKFDPSGCNSAHERLRIFIAGADYSETNTLFLKNFDISGDSCIPAITDDDMQGIFEEQEVVDQLSEASPSIEKLPVGKVVFAVQENTLAFGPMLCNQTTSKGQMERVKITNPTKIDCKIKFSVTGQETPAAVTTDPKAKKGKGDPPPVEASGPLQAFTVHPESWDIPPHEYRFVNVYFNPTELKTYKSVFNAEVDTAGLEAVTNADVDRAKKGQKLSFELAGSGTMPCISIEEPTTRDENGVLLDFKRVHVNKSSRKEIILRNDGVMPATCLFDIKSESSADFLFPFNGSSVTVAPGGKETINLSFCPQEIGGEKSDDRYADVKISVLNNPYDTYNIHINGTTYACDAVLDTEEIPGTTNTSNEDASSEELVKFEEINLAAGADQKVSKSIFVRSRANHSLKFECAPAESCQGLISFSPTYGHIGPHSSKEITLTFSSSEPVKIDDASIQCTLSRIEYGDPPVSEDGTPSGEDLTLRGRWDDSMKSLRPATDEDLAVIATAAKALEDYQALKAAEEAKGKKGKDPGPPPPPCMLQDAPDADDGTKMLTETLPEPTFTAVEDCAPQVLNMKCECVADAAKYSCDAGQYITFVPTYMFQNTIHKFNFTNESDITLPLQWTFDENARRKTRGGTANGGTRGSLASRGGTAPSTVSCPFSIEPSFYQVPPKSTKEFTMKFLPLDSGDFEYVMKGETAILPVNEEGEQSGPIRVGVYGTGNRPICHFEVVETPDYLNRRLSTLKNENGVYSPIETGNLRVVELESIGLKTRNTFRFHVINPTGENYDFSWEAVGDPSPSWRCVQSSGMLFAGKRVEMVFEYLPEDNAIAESFFRFKLPKVGLDQLFLFAGKVSEPRVAFSTSKLDFHSVMLGDLGSTETVYLENQEHLPFNFVFDKMSLAQLESPDGAILDIQPRSGMVAPHGRFPIVFTFRPKDEILYNVQIICEIKRKPNKLQINIKGEGYGIHPVITTDVVDNTGMRTINLKPAPTMNYLDFGAVQVLDAITKKINVLNNGKFNFDYLWDSEALNPMIALAGGYMGGTLHKGESMEYSLTFAPQRETSLDGSMVSFTVAGKYTYNISTRGSGVHPALRFSFMHHDFGSCFITSPGGLTVVEDTVLRLTNNDPSNVISIECEFQKTRTLWVDCPPTVLEPGMVLEVPIHFAPRDVKDYAFVLPFVINGTGKANVNILGKGINARLELANQSQRRVNFGTIGVGGSASKSISLVNRSKKSLTIKLIDEGKYGTGALEERCVTFMPKSEVTIAPGAKAAMNIQLTFNPTRRVNQFVEDLYINYAGVTKKLLNVAGKSEGIELGLDTDSLPFGTVVEKSQKVKKLKLENTGDIPITYNWMEATFGPHFSISPLSGKVTPGMDVNFNVTFKPRHVDNDISQDNMLLMVAGYPPLSITCSGVCISQPDDSVQTLSFESVARKAEVKSVKLSNPTDKDWFISSSLRGDHWKVPVETKVPAKGSADLSVTYFPLTMSSEEEHIGQLFIPLPDGSAQLYNLQGKAGSPECSGVLSVETVAKKPAMVTARIENWLSEAQKFTTSIEMLEQPSPACFLVAANAVEVGPNGVKEFHMRFSSFAEGNAKTRITFTNPNSGEYCFYDVHATVTGTEVLEEIIIEAPVRQSARYMISADNPLPKDAIITMGNADEWYTCDSKAIKVNEIHGFSGYSEGSFEIEYRPLLPTKGPEEHLLTIHSVELGAFKYKLKVTATPPSSRQSLNFDVPLGTQQTENFKFKVFNHVNTTFKCSVTKSDVFSVPATLSAEAIKSWDGEEMVLGVTFEPTEIGKINDVLTITSEDGGEYICELFATCNPPLPQGPFAFSKGSSVDIPFRNCFPVQSSWAFQVDSSLFQIKASTASVGPKAAGSVTVAFEPTPETPAGVVSAKLFVRCESKPELPPWVFYLKGKVEAGDADTTPAGTGKKK